VNFELPNKLSFYLQKLKGKGNNATLARGAVGNFTIKIAGTGLVFLVQVVGARILGTDGYGIYNYAFAWMTMLALLGQMGFDTASVRYIAVYYSEERWGLLRGFLLYSSWAVTLASFASALALAIGAWLWRSHLSQELLYSFWLAALLLPLTTLLKLYEQRLIALKKVTIAPVPGIILRNILVLLGVLVWSRLVPTMQSSNFMLITLICTAIALVNIIYLWQREISDRITNIVPLFDRIDWLKTGRAMILVSSLQVILAQSDTIMIGALVGTTETGLYTAARKIAGLLLFPLIAVNSILGPMVVALYQSNDRAKLQSTVSLAVNSIFFLTAAIAFGIAIAGKPILGLFGSEFRGSYFLLLIHLFGQLVNAMAGPVALLLNMTGYHNDTAKILLVSTLINIILNGLLIPDYGAVGASIATAVATILWNVTMAIVVWRKMKIISIFVPKFLLPKSNRE
jgi:O-antigen/teichoic acid export membrane protein